jgi:acrylyl-CoA reductase (NADPH)
LNYKDGMVLMGNMGGLVRNLPHVPGIDFAGVVEESSDARYEPGDKVILTGWGVGERYWGGFSEYARVRADFLVKMPEGFSAERAMAVGTAGFTAMLSVMALEGHGLDPTQGPVLVTGAGGGVGTMSVMLLSSLGYEVVASTGRESLHERLRELGASDILPRESLSDSSGRPLESQYWAGCIDSVGGKVLSRVFGQMKSGGSVASCGLAGGSDITTSVMPFLLRGVNLLGINSVDQPYAVRVDLWDRMSDLLDSRLDSVVSYCGLEDVREYGERILRGEIFGRLVVRVD